MRRRVPNPFQQKAIDAINGPLLIIAGPGSGKTFTLVERILNLITRHGIEPERMLVVTFTEKAAAELTTRISTRLNALRIRFNLNEMYLGTFHSICLRWLEEYREYTRLKRNYTMMDEFDQQYFIYQHLSDYLAIPGIEVITGPAKTPAWIKSEGLMKWINTVSEEVLDYERLKDAKDEPIQVLGRCAEIYQGILEEENALDFSTIQAEALRLLESRPDVLQTLRDKLSYLMVDEYQDTNTIQEKILLLLAHENPNICVVGDDDQGLYRFRGATIRNILQFKENFTEGQCRQINLRLNYRSHPDIIRFFRRWIVGQKWRYKGKTYRFPKVVKPDPDTVFSASPSVVKINGGSATEFHREVLDFLHTLRDQGKLKDWNQVAFLFRSVKNRKAIALSRFLEENGITVYSPRSNQFFEREEIRLMIGALIFLFPQFQQVRKWKSDANLEIWDYYDHKCFGFFADELRKPENEDLRKWGSARAKEHLALAEPADYAFAGLFFRLLQFPLFSRYLSEDLQTGGVRESRAMRNLAILSQLLGKFEYLNHIAVLTPDYLDKNIKQLFNNFFRFLYDGGLDEYEDMADYAPSGCVSFLTIHQSKGLEFPIVVVDSLGVTPRKQYSELDVILEGGYISRPPFEPIEKTKEYDFRRLFYTAFSRAQNLLVLACHETKRGSYKAPSKYFEDHFNRLQSWRDPAFRVEDLPLDEIREIDLKKEYTFTSHISLYENCAEQYRFFRELEFAPIRTSPILFGTLVHETIEDIHKTVLKGEETNLSEERVGGWFDTNYAYLVKREHVYLSPAVKRIALDHVLRYYRRNKKDWSRIKEAEVDVSLVKDEYILKGKIDLITGKNNTVELVDFKSEKKPDINNPTDREKIDRYRRQLEVYAHIVEERTGQSVSRTHLYYTSEESGNPYISFDKDNKAIEKTISTFDAIVHRIEQKDFAIDERPAKLCKECDMRLYCDNKRWTFRRSE